VKAKEAILILLVAAVVAGAPGVVCAFNPAEVHRTDGFAVGVSIHSEADINSFGYRLLGLLNKHWSDEQRLQVAGSIAANGLVVSAAAAPGVYVQYDNLRVFAGVEGEAEVTAPQKLAQLAFKGITLDQVAEGEVYDLSEVSGKGGVYSGGGLSASFSLAEYMELPIEDIVVGVSGRYLYGLAYAETDLQGTIEVGEQDGVTSVMGRGIDLAILHSKGGQGWAFDAGIAAQIDARLAVSASVENIGQITWTDVTRERRYIEGETELLRLGWNSETNEFEFEFADDGELLEDKSSADDITWKLPMRVRVGVTYAFDQQVTLRGSVRHTVYESGSSDTLFGGQIEYRPLPFVPLTVGASYSAQANLGLEAGVGLRFDHFQAQLAAKNLQSLVMKAGRGLGLAVTMGLNF